ncbi:capsule biosynthesis protein [Aquabacterium sp. J223]|uniref:capsule biosynthesis protein n=1 Tax=Aquabacterium sp. J223 TaxID=2898431 RepID=UPI0021ADDE78|nr:capsular biosynthesis protein [Aquabacterium sp. J223]UUX94119.1 capsular biosynthesis protein [Aquabacterium sp. J223]
MGEPRRTLVHAELATVPTAATAALPRSLNLLLQHRNVLLLQGPMGPFFDRLAGVLQRRGTTVTKVHFNGGDETFFSAGRALAFDGSATEWEAWLRRLLCTEGQSAIVLFGQMRPLHQAACGVAESLGVEVFVLEEGYFRPHYVTLEQGGVNARSRLPRDLAALRQARPPKPPRPADTRSRFRRAAWHAVRYAVATAAARGRYPHYRHHRELGVAEALRWTRGGLRKLRYRLTERGLRQRLYGEASRGNWFLVPLQVHNDSQVVHSDFGSIEVFVGNVIDSFADHAPPGSLLVFKHHPMDLSHRDYRRLLARLATECGVGDRVVYLHDGHLPTLLQRARGMVTINSTSALQALHHGCPVLTLGESFYTVDGLVRRGALHAFWREPGEVDPLLFARYRNLVVSECQLNASFHGDAPVFDLLGGPPAVNEPRVRAPRFGLRSALQRSFVFAFTCCALASGVLAVALAT